MARSTRNRLIAFDDQLGAHRPIVDQAPVSSSAGRDWRGFLFELHRVEAQELVDVLTPYTLVGMHLGEATRVEVREDGPFEAKTFQPGDIALIPAGTKYSIRFDSPAEFMIMSLDPDLLSRASQNVHGNGDSELPTIWCHKDRFIRETFQNIRTAVEQSRQNDRMYAETLANSLAMHLVRNCNRAHGCACGRNARGLSRHQLARTIEFIRSSVYCGISLKTMAAAAGLSLFHFSRMFKLSTGLSPHQFVLRRRLEIGADMLTDSKTAISVIASDLGFADQSHFTMHFKRQNGIAPAAFRRQNRQ